MGHPLYFVCTDLSDPSPRLALDSHFAPQLSPLMTGP